MTGSAFLHGVKVGQVYRRRRSPRPSWFIVSALYDTYVSPLPVEPCHHSDRATADRPLMHAAWLPPGWHRAGPVGPGQFIRADRLTSRDYALEATS